jgi:ubiquinone/menaquinone biosynthesis C-methylase UbiE
MEANKPLDTTSAQAYEKFLVPAFQGPQAVEAVNIASPKPGEQVLDVCCGTGVAVRLALPRVAPGGRVTGLDIDPAMIEVARSLAHGSDGVTSDWYCTSAQKMPFDNGTFDLVFCLQGLQFLPDCTAGLAEMRRVMKPGGRLVAIVWDAIELCEGQYAVVQILRRRNVDATPMLKANALGDAGKVRTHAENAGFSDVSVRAVSGMARFPSIRDFIEALSEGGVASRVAMSKVPENQRSEFYEEITSALRPYENSEGVMLPAGYLVLVARS